MVLAEFLELNLCVDLGSCFQTRVVQQGSFVVVTEDALEAAGFNFLMIPAPDFLAARGRHMSSELQAPLCYVRSHLISRRVLTTRVLY